jgi:hypothetical protein
MEWISVRDEMPNEGQTVLIFTAGESIGVGYFGGEEGWVVECMPWGEEEAEGDDIEVTHWMPPPLPPSWQNHPAVDTNTEGKTPR